MIIVCEYIIMAGRYFGSSTIFILFLLFTVSIKTQKSSTSLLKRSSVLICYGLDRKDFPGRNSLVKRFPRASPTSPYLKSLAGLQLSYTFLCASYLLLLAGDISTNPGPRKAIELCGVCGKGCRSTQKAIECEECEKWFHAKCVRISNMEFKDYAKNPSLYWACSTCIFPGEISINETTFELPSEGTGNSPADDDPLQDRNLMGNIQLDPVEPGAEGIPENTELERLRNQHKKELLIAHLNINSIQNKFEELCKIIKDLQIHVMFISETKIDSSYPDSQFSMAGYSLYRNDRKKGGGGIMALISTALVKKRLKINKNYKTVETLAFEIKTNKGNMVILVIYRPPTLLCGNYRLELENELS
ncbi:uncharacterized protein LOC125573817 [Nematostella vectensis]|uniref:uncharacterized protein LOC125573817 n=1 Tax=Nematostella vectensis TaxID=45351 RepID=UPI0020775A1F|nr:uncharacterized protein LOC125573817 [Nematostella vectensis]